MPLSENEQRQLEAIERALLADDPKFAATVRSSDLRRYYRRRVVRSAVVFVIGLGLLACTLFNVAYGIAGFVVMFAAAISAMSALKRMRHPSETRFMGGQHPARGGRAQTQAARGGWRERVEERFKRRFDERG